jgi:3-hydroxy-9,10-secoandrosta-1,3,5(10)-triene-9,17-dione monooxygenase reductase component
VTAATLPGAREADALQDEKLKLSQWKQSMGQFASGVVVITARDASGNAVGTTVSAFSSVSLQPRLLLACLDRQSRTLAAIRLSGCFAVNVLAAGEAQLAFNFGRKGSDQFAGV